MYYFKYYEYDLITTSCNFSRYFFRMFKEGDNGPGGCNGGPPRPRRIFPRFSLRRLLYSSPLIGRRITRTPSASNKNAKGIF